MLRSVCIFLSGLFICCQADNVIVPTKQKGSVKQVLNNHVAAMVMGADGPLQTDSLLLIKQINKLLKRAGAEHFSTQYALLADLGLHSGSKRMYLVKLSAKTIIQKALVAHGSTTSYLPAGQRLYSNTEGSLCSSLGMYKIGAPYQGSFGLAYKLYGLDSGNSHAFVRTIVLHSYSGVPDEETTNPICQSWGCPMVSPAFLQTVARLIDAADKPMLLYLFDSSNK